MPTNFILLIITFIGFRLLYARSLRMDDSVKISDDAELRRRTMFRQGAMACLLAHIVCCFRYPGSPLPIEWLKTYPWDHGLSIAPGLLLMCAAAYYLARGLRAAGRWTFIAAAPDKLLGGVYRELRHPQFLGCVLFLSSLSLLGDSPLLLALALAWLWSFITLIPAEERELEQRLGEAYADYRRSTGRFVTFEEPHRPSPPKNCLNCGTALDGPYCRQCGQRGIEVNRSLGGLAGEYLRTELRRNPRFLRTLLPLLFRPGFLTAEFLAGRRVRYLSPLRVYLTASAVAFFLLVLAGQRIKSWDAVPGRGSPADTTHPAHDQTMRFLRENVDDDSLLERAEVEPRVRDSLVTDYALKEAVEDTALARALRNPLTRDSALAELVRGEALGNNITIGLGDSTRVTTNTGRDTTGTMYRFVTAAARGWNKAKKEPRRVIEAAVARLTQAMFVLMPLFALLLKLLYIRHRRFYLQHLVFALHFHTTAFLVLAIITAGNLWTPPQVAGYGDLLAWLIPLHLFLGMKRFYRQGWFKTAFKFVLLSFTYLVIASLGAAAAVLVSLASL